VRRIVMLAFDDVQILDVTGPLEVFSRTARWLVENGRRADLAYVVEIVGAAEGPLTTSSGLRLVADRGYGAVRGDVDTLLVAGGRGAAAAASDRALIACITRMSRTVRRLGSVCTGSFILAAAGLLDTRRATTHWAHCDELARRYPGVAVDPNPIFIKDGDVYTSAGVTAGMDLALALVESDFGRDVALQVARQLVMFVTRPGGQSQFSAQLAVQSADREPLRELQVWIADHVAADLSVTALAARAAMSPRNFARVFVSEAVRRARPRRGGAAPARGVDGRVGGGRAGVWVCQRGSNAAGVRAAPSCAAGGLPEPVQIRVRAVARGRGARCRSCGTCG
jgi:transcriptional regulator GlxA family with amidase domain